MTGHRITVKGARLTKEGKLALVRKIRAGAKPHVRAARLEKEWKAKGKRL